MDLVLALALAGKDVRAFSAAFPIDDFYCPPVVVIETERARTRGVDPTFGSLSIDVIDYKDIDGYQAAIDAGRASWPFSYAGAEGYLREGGAIASATTYAYF